jgi:WD40 repeat protein
VFERVGLLPESPSGNLYHGFISYSHAADGKLAPALQNGLHRFAKPWYRVRALHVFRDEANLAANPYLWDSIAEALDASRFYILLASPQAAASQWVANEARRWIAKDEGCERLLIGWTDGELVWDERSADFDWERTTAISDVLKGAFEQEPRWVDLRWARTRDHLALSHPRFRDAVAEFAAPLHGKPKQELASDEVREHRRTIRVARTATAALFALTATAVVFGLLAYAQYRSAQARALAAQATALLTSDPQRSLSLALQSTETDSSNTGEETLRMAVAAAPLRTVIRGAGGESAVARWNPAAEQIALSGPRGSIQLWDARRGRLQRSLAGDPRSSIVKLNYSPDGTLLAALSRAGDLAVWDLATGRRSSSQTLARAIAATTHRDANGELAADVGFDWHGPHYHHLLVFGSELKSVLSFDPATGRVTDVYRNAGGFWQVMLSPDRERLFVGYSRDFLGGAAIIDLGTGRRRVLRGPSARFDWSYDACWTRGPTRIVTFRHASAGAVLPVLMWNPDTGRQVARSPSTGSATIGGRCGAGFGWFALAGSEGQVRLRMSDGATSLLQGHTEAVPLIASSPTGEYLATGSNDGTARVWNSQTATLLRVLRDGERLTSVQFNRDGGLALTVNRLGIVRIWDAGVGEPLVRLENTRAGPTQALGFIRSGELVYGIRADNASGRPRSIVYWSAATGRQMRQIRLPATAATEPRDAPDHFGQALVSPRIAPRLPGGPLGLAISPDGSEIVYTVPRGVEAVDSGERRVASLPLPSSPVGLSFASGSDRIAVITRQAVYVWRPRHGPAVALSRSDGTIDAQLSGDGSRLVTATKKGDVVVWNAETAEATAVLHPRGAHPPGSSSDPAPLRVAISRNGRRIAAGSRGGDVSIWDSRDTRPVAVSALTLPNGTNRHDAVAELSFSASGEELVAVNYPIGGNFAPPAAAAVFRSSDGAVLDRYESPSTGPVDQPGSALSPDGAFLLTGVLGLAPSPPGGETAIYEVASGRMVLDLRNAVRPHANRDDAAAPFEAWSPNGRDVLVGSSIYACHACGSVKDLQDVARTRVAWSTPLSSTKVRPPPGDPFR